MAAESRHPAQGSIIWNVLADAFRFDWPFHETRMTGPGIDTQRVLHAFWSRPEWADLVSLAAVAEASWEDLQMAVARRLDAPASEPPARWRQLAAESERVAKEDGLAACVLAMQAFAAVQGVRSRASWWEVAAVLGRNLVATEAFFSARHLTDVCLSRLWSADRADAALEQRDAYLAIRDEATRRLDVAYQELAWELRASCGAGVEGSRPLVAALLWTTGDVPRARLVSEGGSLPPPALFRHLVERSIHRLGDDPLLQHLWLWGKQHLPFDLRAHRLLFPSINVRYRTFAHEQLENVPLSYSMSAVYARTLVEHLGRASNPDSAGEYDSALAMCSALLPGLPASFTVRLDGLQLLMADDQAAADAGWWELARISIEAARRASLLGNLDGYDRSLDIPFHHLHGLPAEERAALMEAYRAASQWHWLRAIRHGQPVADPDAIAPLLRERDELVNLRDARWKLVMSRLPSAQQYGSDAFDEQGPFDEAAATADLAASHERLERIWTTLDPHAPSYVYIRRHPVPSLDDLAFLLGKHRLRRSR